METSFVSFGQSNVFPICYATFELLIALGLTIIFSGYLVLRKRQGDILKPLPFKSILISILFYIGAEICAGVYNSIYRGRQYQKNSYPVAEPISEGLLLIAINLLFYSFYATVHLFGEQITRPNNLWPGVKIIHWVLLGIFVSVSIADFGWYVYNVLGQMQFIPESTILRHYQTWAKIQSAKWILFWLGSWEILGALMFMGMKASSRAPHMRMSTYFALTAGSFFFALNGLWAVWSINSYLAHIYPTQVAIAAREVIQFFFCMGSYLGLGLCFWRFPANYKEDLEGTFVKRSIGLVEADSGIPEATPTESVLEGSQRVVEVPASRPILEADSNVTHEKPS